MCHLFIAPFPNVAHSDQDFLIYQFSAAQKLNRQPWPWRLVLHLPKAALTHRIVTIFPAKVVDEMTRLSLRKTSANEVQRQNREFSVNLCYHHSWSCVRNKLRTRKEITDDHGNWRAYSHIFCVSSASTTAVWCILRIWTILCLWLLDRQDARNKWFQRVSKTEIPCEVSTLVV